MSDSTLPFPAVPARPAAGSPLADAPAADAPAADAPAADACSAQACSADLERRFGGLARLYGPGAPERLRAARIAVVGLGGVGSWTAEALARCGVGRLALIDLDHIAESNINRQVHALSATLGQAKVQAMAERIAGIHPACRVACVDDFLTPGNAAQLLDPSLDMVIDCTDQAAAKVAMILLARQRRQPLVVCGGAGGKTDALALRAGDLSESTHDALLARLRNILRKQHGYPKPAAAKAGKPGRVPRMGVRVLWVEQPAILPSVWTAGIQADDAAPQGLSCAGYGSVVTVTAAMGLAAANMALRQVLAQD
ncbi:tRNA threonylcarbamoyladenosine dehydratase [Orrella sp. JC864]|uniref:tRNA threonylcarbamoyladenosine dehydratase n=1 Tax=Orrella sp. JC864 TaxID=3120298 RepID=UPI003008C67E